MPEQVNLERECFWAPDGGPFIAGAGALGLGLRAWLGVGGPVGSLLAPVARRPGSGSGLVLGAWLGKGIAAGARKVENIALQFYVQRISLVDPSLVDRRKMSNGVLY